MISAAEIKAHINGIAETKKITDAMYKISSAKMSRALRDLENTTPYFEALAEKIGDLFVNVPATSNRYFKVTLPENTPHSNHGIVLITSDKGLAGDYNHAAINMCEQYMERHPLTTLFVIGEYGRQYFSNKNIPFAADFRYSLVRPQITDARSICADILEYYDRADLDEINIIYTDYMGNRPGECKKVTILPLDRTRFFNPEKAGEIVEKELITSPDEVLDGIIPSYIMGFIYGCLVESFCSEQQARIMAMKNASDNAEKMIKELKVKYNNVRQTAITREITEITAGARALKRKKEPPQEI